MSVHNHPPYRPWCDERTVNGQLRGACLNDDGTDKTAMSESSGSGSCEVCGDPIVPGTLHDILDHLRVMHPDVYGDGPEMWPDGGPVIEVDESAVEPGWFQ